MTNPWEPMDTYRGWTIYARQSERTPRNYLFTATKTPATDRSAGVHFSIDRLCDEINRIEAEAGNTARLDL